MTWAIPPIHPAVMSLTALVTPSSFDIDGGEGRCGFVGNERCLVDDSMFGGRGKNLSFVIGGKATLADGQGTICGYTRVGISDARQRTPDDHPVLTQEISRKV